jgi:hypothetical protein
VNTNNEPLRAIKECLGQLSTHQLPNKIPALWTRLLCIPVGCIFSIDFYSLLILMVWKPQSRTVSGGVVGGGGTSVRWKFSKR